jgi:hypothetical protein
MSVKVQERPVPIENVLRQKDKRKLLALDGAESAG